MNLSENLNISSFHSFCIFSMIYFSPLSHRQCAQIDQQKSARKYLKIKNNQLSEKVHDD